MYTHITITILEQIWNIDVHDLSGMIHPFVIARTMELGRIIDNVCRSARLAEKDIKFIYRQLLGNPKFDREICRTDTAGSIGMYRGLWKVNRVDIVLKGSEPSANEPSSLSSAAAGSGASL